MELATKERKAEMYKVIEDWLSSGESQRGYCKSTGLSISTFKYWYTKYKSSKGKQSVSSAIKPKNKPTQTFIPVKLPTPTESLTTTDQLKISYPNGVSISCPVDMEVTRLKSLLHLF